MDPIGDASERYSVKFYMVAMLFILFDVEAVFLYPWAVILRELKMFGFWEMMVYIAVIFVGPRLHMEEGCHRLVEDRAGHQEPSASPAPRISGPADYVGVPAPAAHRHLG